MPVRSGLTRTRDLGLVEWFIQPLWEAAGGETLPTSTDMDQQERFLLSPAVSTGNRSRFVGIKEVGRRGNKQDQSTVWTHLINHVR